MNICNAYKDCEGCPFNKDDCTYESDIDQELINKLLAERDAVRKQYGCLSPEYNRVNGRLTYERKKADAKEYQKRYYQKHREEIIKKHMDRYYSDEEFRERKKKAALRQSEKKRKGKNDAR